MHFDAHAQVHPSSAGLNTVSSIVSPINFKDKIASSLKKYYRRIIIPSNDNVTEVTISTDGQYMHTLQMVDVATSWSEFAAIWDAATWS